MKDSDYYQKRKDSRSFGHRLERRAFEIYDCIIRHQKKGDLRILDIGTADGSMIDHLSGKLPEAAFVGADISLYLLSKAKGKKLIAVCSDACKLPFKEDTFDVITGAAVIEHLYSVEKFMEEIVRILKKSGLCIFTTPNPLHDYIVSTVLPWYGKDHINRLSLRALRRILSDYGVMTLTAKGFLFLPCALPCERLIEKVVNKMKLSFLLFNQIIAGRKQEE